jgi:hypothetical protein
VHTGFAPDTRQFKLMDLLAPARGMRRTSIVKHEFSAFARGVLMQVNAFQHGPYYLASSAAVSGEY